MFELPKRENSNPIKPRIKTVAKWIEDLENNFQNSGGLYDGALAVGIDKGGVLASALRMRGVAGYVEDATGLFSMLINKRLLNTEIDEHEWSKVFLCLYPSIQNYLIKIFLREHHRGDPFHDLTKEFVSLTTWMHVYFG